MGKWMYWSTFSWPRHYVEVSGQLHAPAALPPEKTPRTHWIGGWMDPRSSLDDLEKRKFLTPLGLNSDPSVVQPVASRYTDYATRTP
jgi:hypothetical protein